jgi:hypothetical protein
VAINANKYLLTSQGSAVICRPPVNNTVVRYKIQEGEKEFHSCCA